MKKDLIILHGALGSASQLKIIKPLFDNQFNCYFLDFIGHGKLSNSDKEVNIESFSTQLFNFIQEKKLDEVYILGYSMGGYVALNLLQQNICSSIKKLVTIGTKLDWSITSAEKEVLMLNADVIENKVPVFADMLKERHGKSFWKLVLENTKKLMLRLGENPLIYPSKIKSVNIPVLLLLSDCDEMVSKEETTKISNALPNSVFKIIGDSKHPIEKINFDILKKEVSQFLTKEKEV